MSVRAAVEQRDQTPAEISPKQALRQLLEQNSGAIGSSLPSGMSTERFTRLLLTAANTNPDLFNCDPRSFLAAGVACAQLGLEPNDARGLAYLIPFNDKRRGKVVNLILGYRGLMDLARRSGMVTSIYSFPVFEGDRFEYRLGIDPDIVHVPAEHDEDPAKLTHVYAVAKVQGDPQFVVLTRAQVDKARAQSAGARSSSSPWSSHYVEMAKKTAIRRLCKMLPLTVEVAQAVDSDERTLMLGDLGGLDQVVTDDEDVIDTDVVADPELPAVDSETGEVEGGEAA
jgi:recombination protein RecT